MAAIGSVTSIMACDLTATNPGPVDDGTLNIESANDAVVYGAMLAFNAALAGSGESFAMCGGLVAREWYPSGQTGAYACSIQEMRNQLTSSNASEVDKAQEARWLAEDGVRRIEQVRGDSFQFYPLAAPLLLYVGYANRLLGENVCATVIDGGPQLPFTIHFARADSAFTAALAIAQVQHNDSLTAAAYAGRASVRVWEGNWDGAVADAEQVPAAFVYRTPFNTADASQSNGLAIATEDVTHRNFTLYDTWYADNFDQYADPRTPYRKYPDTPDSLGLGSVPDLGDGRGPLGKLPYYQQRMYTEETPGLSSAPITLSSGHEAMLIIAEADLRQGDWQSALGIINQIRSAVGVEQRQAATLDSTWTLLKEEKLIELWLQGRAVGERRRWLGDGPDPAAPGDLPAKLAMDDRAGKDRCWPISLDEMQTNPHLNGGSDGS